MKTLFVALVISSSIGFAQNLPGIKKCHDLIISDIIGYGFVTNDYVFVPSKEDKTKFLISNGKTHYLCSTAPDSLKDRNQIFINQNIEGFSKTYIAAKNDNRHSWGLFPISEIDPKVRKLIAECKKVVSEDKEAAQIYTDHTRQLLLEMKSDYQDKVSSTVANYDLARMKPTSDGDAKQIESKQINRSFQKALDQCRESSDLQETAIQAEKNISFVIVDRKNSQTKLPTRDIKTPTKVKSTPLITLPPASKQ